MSRDVNEIVPAEVGYLNTIISKKSLRDIISDVIKAVGVARACEFLDGNKNLGYYMVGQQRVKATITSILVGDKFINVKLSVFDNDGMEGFYVPESSCMVPCFVPSSVCISIL